jgi:hypothetical protein
LQADGQKKPERTCKRSDEKAEHDDPRGCERLSFPLIDLSVFSHVFIIAFLLGKHNTKTGRPDRDKF